MEKPVAQEKRKHIRFPSNRPVIMIINNRNVYATMTDFSRHGIGFMASETADIHSRIEVHFDVPTDTQNSSVQPFQFKAEVKHCINHNHENHIGVRIELPTEEYKNLFDRLVAA